MLRYSLALFLFSVGCGAPERAVPEEVSVDRKHVENMAAINAMLEEVRLLKEQQRQASVVPKPEPVKPELIKPDKLAGKKQGPKKAVSSEPPQESSKGGIIIKTGVDDPLDGL